MNGNPSLAVLGAKPTFDEPLTVGQSYWPDWTRYEAAARDIFARRFYTSQRFAGPLVVKLQRRLQEFLGVKHAIAVRNGTSGLMIATSALGLRGKVIVPAWTFIATVQALIWSKCEPVFCDIDFDMQQTSPDSVRRLLKSGGINGILAVHLWGNAAPVHDLEVLSREYNVPLYYDAAHAFGCTVNGRSIGAYGRTEVFSFSASNIMSTGEGGCITTNDDELAVKFAAMRGDETAPTSLSMQSATARMSELQAAIGLMMLDDFERNRSNNEAQHYRYQTRLSAISGLRVLEPSAVTKSNFQYLVVVLDQKKFRLTRDQLLEVLVAESIIAERLRWPSELKMGNLYKSKLSDQSLHNTKLIAENTLVLPIGACVTIEQIDRICAIIREAHVHSTSIVAALRSRATS